MHINFPPLFLDLQKELSRSLSGGGGEKGERGGEGWGVEGFESCKKKGCTRIQIIQIERLNQILKSNSSTHEKWMLENVRNVANFENSDYVL